MGLSSAGVGSGLDVKTIVSSLMAAEQKPLNSLNSQKSQYSTKLSSFGSFKNNLAQYQTTLVANYLAIPHLPIIILRLIN
jgi:flagellar hook-associated protein 2